jgi:hypothetical protein
MINFQVNIPVITYLKHWRNKAMLYQKAMQLIKILSLVSNFRILKSIIKSNYNKLILIVNIHPQSLNSSKSNLETKLFYLEIQVLKHLTN